MLQKTFPKINLAHPQQDVHQIRKHNSELYRYKVAEKLLPENSSILSVLELGGGIGEYSRRMKNRGFNVTFVDLNRNNIKIAKSLGLEAYEVDLNLGLTMFPKGKFDGVIMLEVIEHIVAAEFLLEEINRVLKPCGFLVISTPNFAYFQNRLRILFGKLSIDEGYHYRFFTVETLTRHLRNAGFIVEKTAHTMPAIGINLIRNKIFKKPRLHVQVPNFIAPLFALTLFVKARKGKK